MKAQKFRCVEWRECKFERCRHIKPHRKIMFDGDSSCRFDECDEASKKVRCVPVEVKP